jgi:hypothetical protein
VSLRTSWRPQLSRPRSGRWRARRMTASRPSSSMRGTSRRRDQRLVPHRGPHLPVVRPLIIAADIADDARIDPRQRRFDIGPRVLIYPSQEGGHGASAPSSTLQILPRQNDPTGKSLKPVQPSSKKYFAFAVGQISSTSSPRPFPARGALRDRHERGMGCGGRSSVGA